MSSEVEQFYDSMADFYHLIFEDWNQAISRQAHIVDALIKYKLGTSSLRILDCACGIGTQVLGLAAIGHRLSGSDLSNEAVQRARHEAAKRELDVEFRVSDMTSLEEFSSDHFDVVGAFDNALPHLSVDQLTGAAHSFKRVLRDGGLFIASIRDYDELIRTRPKFQGPSFFGDSGERRIVHQIWDWTGDDRYDVHQYISLQRNHKWGIHHFSSQYRCLLRAELGEALRLAEFTDIEWHMPKASGYYQPIVTARAL